MVANMKTIEGFPRPVFAGIALISFTLAPTAAQNPPVSDTNYCGDPDHVMEYTTAKDLISHTDTRCQTISKKHNNVALWPERRKQLLKGLTRLIGDPPALVDPKVRSLEKRWHKLPDGGLYTSERITFSAPYGIQAFAYRLTPHAILHRTAILALQQTHDPGADEVVGIDPPSEPNMDYGRILAQQGYVVIAPDIPGQRTVRTAYMDAKGHDPVTKVGDPDEEMNDFVPTNYKSGLLLTAVVNMELVRYLKQHGRYLTKDSTSNQNKIVHVPRVAVIGHSWGGLNAEILAALDKRVDDAVISGFVVLAPNSGQNALYDETLLNCHYIPTLITEFYSPPSRVTACTDSSNYHDGTALRRSLGSTLDPKRLPTRTENIFALIAPRNLLILGEQHWDSQMQTGLSVFKVVGGNGCYVHRQDDTFSPGTFQKMLGFLAAMDRGAPYECPPSD